MKKILSVLSLSILALVMLMSLTSATISFGTAPTLSQTGTSFDITITSTENEIVTFSGLDSIDTITFTTPSAITLTADKQETITVNYVVPGTFDFEFGESYETLLTASGSVSVDDVTRDLSFAESDYCGSIENDGDLDIEIGDITVNAGFGDEDEYWYLMDEIEIELDFENKGSEDIEDIEVEWCLYDTENKECVLSDEESDFNLDEDDDDSMIITFNLDPDEFQSDVEDYIFYVKATGAVDDGSNTDTCISDSNSIDIIIDKNFVVLSNLETNTETLQCGSSLHVTADVWNIGSKDQDDVYVMVYNKELLLEQRIDFNEVESLDKETLDITFEIPEDAEEKTYAFILKVFDEDDDLFENSEDDESEFTISVKVEGECSSEPEAIIDAELLEGGVAGETLVISAIVTSTSSDLTQYELAITGYSEWAESVEFDETNLILNEGESQEVILTFEIKKDASGDQSFDLDLMSEDLLVTTQPVTVSIEAKQSIWNKFDFEVGDSWYLWLIGALNVLLVVIIIVVAIRVARS